MNETILGDGEDQTENDATLVTDDKDVETEGEKKEESSVEEKSEEKKEDEKGESEKGKDSEADEPEGAPDKYEDFSIPEGLESDKDVMSKAGDVFKELGLTQDQAQKLVDFQAGVKQAEIAATSKAWDDTMDEWKDKSKSDSEFGGTNLDTNMVIAKKGRDAYGNKAFTEMLEITGVGNHPEMVRYLFKVGKAVSDDSILHGKTSADKTSTQAERLFPDMNK